ncbi:MAG: glycosyltransferase family 4 protein [Spirosomaceae bacterium]|nr:glycosyltransferase family 4 protein [Spirosomataceae bacterium]
MRIGFDAKRAFNNRTGLGNYSRFVLNALRNFAPKHEYYAYTPKVKNDLFDFPNPQTPPFTNGLLGAWWRSYGIAKDLKRDKIQLFHGLSNELPHSLAKTGIQSVVTIHDLIFLRYPELYPAIDRFFYQQKFKRACREADIVVAVSQQTKRDIIDFYDTDPSKIKVVYQDCHEVFSSPRGVPSLPLSMTERGEGTVRRAVRWDYILSVGTIEPRKNQLSLVRAFAQAALEEARLVLIGSKTQYQLEIEAFIAQNHLQDKVLILNHVPFADLPAWYRGARVFGYVSVFEGFGIPIVEALHSGVPVLAATGSCLEEAGGGGAVYCAPQDIDDMTKKLKQLWNSEALRQKLIREGQSHVAQFAAPKIATDLMDIYSRLLSR